MIERISDIQANDKLVIRPYDDEDFPSVVQLWGDCGLTTPTNDAGKDIARKQQVDPDLFLVGVLAGKVVATVMAGYEGHRGWINYLAISPELRRSGYGLQMMAEAEKLLIAKGCPKINLQVRSCNKEVISFYTSLGYAVDEVVSLGKRLELDNC